MDEVKRYDMALSPSSDIGQGGYELVRDYGDDGANVDYTDYAKLSAERDAWKRYAEAKIKQYEYAMSDRADWLEMSQTNKAVESAKQALRDLGVME